MKYRDQKSSKEFKYRKLSKDGAASKNQNFKLDSTGGIGDIRNSKERSNDSSIRMNKSNYGNSKRNVKFLPRKEYKTGVVPIQLVGNQNEKLSLKDNDALNEYLKKFIKNNKLKFSSLEQKEEEQVIQKLKDFLIYLEDKNLIISRYKLTHKINELFESLIKDKTHNKLQQKNTDKISNERECGSANDDSQSNSSKHNQFQLLAFRQSRSDKNSQERNENNKSSVSRQRKSSLGRKNLNRVNLTKNQNIRKVSANRCEKQNNNGCSNAFANNRRIMTSISNGSESINSSRLFALNANKRNNPYYDDNYCCKSKIETHSIEHKEESNSGSIQINYFNNCNVKKAQFNSREANNEIKKESSANKLTLRRHSDNVESSFNYYSPQNVESKKVQ